MITKDMDRYPPALDVERHLMPLLGLSRATIYNRLLKMPGFPCLRVGRRLVIPRDAFFVWFEKQTANKE